jgi:hypothetical protein
MARSKPSRSLAWLLIRPALTPSTTATRLRSPRSGASSAVLPRSRCGGRPACAADALSADVLHPNHKSGTHLASYAQCVVCGRARCITTAPFDGHHPTDKIQRVSGPPGDAYPPAAPPAVPAANPGPGTRPEPVPTTHGGYGRNTTSGWLADDPQRVPPRPRACGAVVLGLV